MIASGVLLIFFRFNPEATGPLFLPRLLMISSSGDETFDALLPLSMFAVLFTTISSPLISAPSDEDAFDRFAAGLESSPDPLLIELL